MYVPLAYWQQTGYKIGESIFGGVVAYVAPGAQSGFVVATASLAPSGGMVWGCENVFMSGTNPDVLNAPIGTGWYNTKDILSQCAQTGSATYLAANYTSSTGDTGWVLPCCTELRQIRANINTITGSGATICNSTSSCGVNGTQYWTSELRIPELGNLNGCGYTDLAISTTTNICGTSTRGGPGPAPTGNSRPVLAIKYFGPDFANFTGSVFPS